MRSRIVMLAVLAIVLAACESGASPSASVALTASTQEQAAMTLTPAPASAPSTTRTPRPTPAIPPPPPSAVRITREGCYTGPEPDGVRSGECIQTVTWNEAVTEGTEVRVYGVTRCILQAERAGDGRCLGKHTPVPAALRKLIARAPVSTGNVRWTRPAWLDNVRESTGQPTSEVLGIDRDGDDLYFGIVVAAYNAAGHSAFVLADAGTWCYDTGCVGP